jgi:parvulin-like peptidyl-prolyl isomerase
MNKENILYIVYEELYRIIERISDVRAILSDNIRTESNEEAYATLKQLEIIKERVVDQIVELSKTDFDDEKKFSELEVAIYYQVDLFNAAYAKSEAMLSTYSE